MSFSVFKILDCSNSVLSARAGPCQVGPSNRVCQNEAQALSPRGPRSAGLQVAVSAGLGFS